MTAKRKIISPLIGLFIIFNLFFLNFKLWLAKWGIDSSVMLVANTLFFIISLLAFLMQKKALENSNPNVFIRSVMGGMLMKMAVCVVAIAIYVLAYKDSFSKGSVFAAMFLYLIYLAVEVKVATKMNKQKNA